MLRSAIHDSSNFLTSQVEEIEKTTRFPLTTTLKLISVYIFVKTVCYYDNIIFKIDKN
jgi:hypothetical protein